MGNSKFYDYIVVLGPTASGKTKLGVGLARALNGEIISADSRQVYRGMDIGSGKDLGEYGDVPYHLIDIMDPGCEFSLFDFQQEFLSSYEEIAARGSLPILVGGTGMYIDAILRGYRLVPVPENLALRNELANLTIAQLQDRLRTAARQLHNTTDLLDRERLNRAIEIAEYEAEHPPEPFPELKSVVFGVKWERTELRKRITERLRKRLQEGLVEEVEGLMKSGVTLDFLKFCGLEYRYVAQFLAGELNRNDMFQKLNSAIHDFAKRQDTWFRRMERNGVIIHWLDGDKDPLTLALQILGR